MKGILHKLYINDLCPVEQIVPENSAYRVIGRKITEEMEKWKKRLTEDEYKRLEDLLDLRAQTSDMELEASFEHGFKLGASLMIEVLSDKL
ncbi:DUF6809 family protein [Cohnella sp.]|uniref:DUF6809 family protein n=1 Tax=Cohnella sp. TaxID=1883426 RepID=UPI0037048501